MYLYILFRGVLFMKKSLVLFIALGVFGMTGISHADEIHRFYQPSSGDHLLTTDKDEIANLAKFGWHDEGAFGETVVDGVSLFRVYNPNSGEHFLTLSEKEKANLVCVGWHDEGYAFKVSTNKGQPVFRLFNPNSRNADSHHLTANFEEVNHLVKIGWRHEGVAFYQNPVKTPSGEQDHGLNGSTEFENNQDSHSNNQESNYVNQSRPDSNRTVKVTIVHVDAMNQRLKNIPDTTVFVQPNMETILNADEVEGYRVVDGNYQAAFASDTVIYFTYEPLNMDRKLVFKYFDISENKFIENPIDITGQKAPIEVPEPTYNLYKTHPILDGYKYIDFNADTYLVGPNHPVYRFINGKAEVILNYAKIKTIKIQYVDYDTKKLLREENTSVAIGRDLQNYVTKDNYQVIGSRDINPALFDVVDSQTKEAKIFVKQALPFILRYIDKHTGKLVMQTKQINTFDKEFAARKYLSMPNNYRVVQLKEGIRKGNVEYIDVLVVPAITKVTLEFYDLNNKLLSTKTINTQDEHAGYVIDNNIPENYRITSFDRDVQLEGIDRVIKIFGEIMHPIMVHYIDVDAKNEVRTEKMFITERNIDSLYLNVHPFATIDQNRLSWDEIKTMADIKIYVQVPKTYFLSFIDSNGKKVLEKTLENVIDINKISLGYFLPKGYGYDGNQSTAVKIDGENIIIQVKKIPVFTIKYVDVDGSVISQMNNVSEGEYILSYPTNEMPNGFVLNGTDDTAVKRDGNTITVLIKKRPMYTVNYVDTDGKVIQSYANQSEDTQYVSSPDEWVPRGYSLNGFRSTAVKKEGDKITVSIIKNPEVTFRFVDEKQNVIKEVVESRQPIGGSYNVYQYKPEGWLFVNHDEEFGVTKNETVEILCRKQNIYEIPVYFVDFDSNQMIKSQSIHFKEAETNKHIFDKDGFALLTEINNIEDLNAVYYVNINSLQKFVNNLDYSGLNQLISQKYPEVKISHQNSISRVSTDFYQTMHFDVENMSIKEIKELIQEEVLENLKDVYSWRFLSNAKECNYAIEVSSNGYYGVDFRCCLELIPKS